MSYDRRKAHDYDRTAAPRRKAPPAVPVWTPPSDEKRVESAAESGVGVIVNRLKQSELWGPVLKHLRTTGEQSFSDGTRPSSDYGRSIGYAFTMRYPQYVLAEGKVEIDLAGIEAYVKDHLDGTVDATVIETVLPTVDLGKALLVALRDNDIPRDDFDLDEKFKDALFDTIDEKRKQSIEAYSYDEPTVHLPEYPAVYLRYTTTKMETDLGPPQQHGTKWTVPVRVTWEVRATHWNYDSNAREMDWYRLH